MEIRIRLMRQEDFPFYDYSYTGLQVTEYAIQDGIVYVRFFNCENYFTLDNQTKWIEYELSTEEHLPTDVLEETKLFIKKSLAEKLIHMPVMEPIASVEQMAEDAKPYLTEYVWRELASKTRGLK